LKRAQGGAGHNDPKLIAAGAGRQPTLPSLDVLNDRERPISAMVRPGQVDKGTHFGLARRPSVESISTAYSSASRQPLVHNNYPAVPQPYLPPQTDPYGRPIPSHAAGQYGYAPSAMGTEDSRSEYGGAARSEYGGAARSEYGGAARSEYGGAARSEYGGAARSEYGGAARSEYGGTGPNDYGAASRYPPNNYRGPPPPPSQNPYSRPNPGHGYNHYDENRSEYGGAARSEYGGAARSEYGGSEYGGRPNNSGYPRGPADTYGRNDYAAPSDTGSAYGGYSRVPPPVPVSTGPPPHHPYGNTGGPGHMYGGPGSAYGGDASELQPPRRPASPSGSVHSSASGRFAGRGPVGPRYEDDDEVLPDRYANHGRTQRHYNANQRQQTNYRR
jgi:hypothetical protein